ncbi:MAG TPA: hypothetical protein VFB66_06875 [Tepidisphaeraceae bacterium]|nr:hypothetical protein [Tepidisphaeraceae bacterium]
MGTKTNRPIRYNEPDARRMVRSKTGNSLPRRLVSKTFFCGGCGATRRAPAAPEPTGPPPPACCGQPMRMLTDEQAVACARLPKRRRVEWMESGGKVERRGGKRQWKAVWS